MTLSCTIPVVLVRECSASLYSLLKPHLELSYTNRCGIPNFCMDVVGYGKFCERGTCTSPQNCASPWYNPSIQDTSTNYTFPAPIFIQHSIPMRYSRKMKTIRFRLLHKTDNSYTDFYCFRSLQEITHFSKSS